ncbi:MAG: pseudouridine synthase [Candidatus Saccharimonadales bacterium]
MRINKFVAQASHLSRRKADQAIASGQVLVNNQPPNLGQDITATDVVTLRGQQLKTPVTNTTIVLNKPAGFVVSRDGQGGRTIYDLLPPEYQSLNPVGRLDKYSSGLLLLTNDGQLAQDLTHPSHQKVKIYEILLDKPLEPLHQQMISDYGVRLEDGPSKPQLERQIEGDDIAWIVTMSEGRNRQIRRTFDALGYRVTHLHRTNFGPYVLDDLKPGKTRPV